MGRAKPVVIAYDISKSKIRNRVFRLLKQWRLDGQKSVHECRLTDAEAHELFLQLGHLIDTKKDLLLMAWIVPNGGIPVLGLGKNRLRGDLVHIR